MRNLIRVVGLFVLLAAMSCSSKGRSEPVFMPIHPLVPSILDGTALDVSDSRFQLKFTSVEVGRFGVSEAKVWRGGGIASQVEVKTFESVVRLSLESGLPPGMYDLRFKVAAGVLDEEMNVHFRPGRTAGEWTLRFYVGPKFCLVRAGLCREVGQEWMALYLRWSSPSAELSASSLLETVRLSYDQKAATCELATGLSAVSHEEMTFRCTLPAGASGTARVAFDSPPLTGLGGEPATNCESSAALAGVEMPYEREGCGSYAWSQ
jgi:hypothetical protein